MKDFTAIFGRDNKRVLLFVFKTDSLGKESKDKSRNGQS